MCLEGSRGDEEIEDTTGDIQFGMEREDDQDVSAANLMAGNFSFNFTQVQPHVVS